MLTRERTSVQTPTAGRVAPSLGTAQGDDRIASRALDALEYENLLPALRVRVRVEHGWLTMSGNAAHTVERAAADCVVRYVPGVKGVTNDIVVTTADRR